MISDIKAVDTVLGSIPPAARSGDLATLQPDGIGATTVLAKGCVNPTDGGGGLFEWDSSSFMGDDGGTIVVPAGSTSGRWRRNYSGAINVRWFGAGLGGDDDQPAIQAAVSLAASRGGGTVFFPAGTYLIREPIRIAGSGIRIVGDNNHNAIISKVGFDTTTIEFGAASLCEVSHIRFSPAATAPEEFIPYYQRSRHYRFTPAASEAINQPTNLTFTPDSWHAITHDTNLTVVPTASSESGRFSGAVIRFLDRALGIRIIDVWIDNAWCCISCEVSPAPEYVPQTTVNEVIIDNVEMTGVLSCGIYAQYALNWMVSNTVIGMRSLPGQRPHEAWPSGCGANGVRLDTSTEGWIWTSVFVLGGEHCWRFDNTVKPKDRRPQEHRLFGCFGDNGSSSCFYASALSRCFFSGCWASAQTPGAVGFRADTLAVQELIWTAGEMVNIAAECFRIDKAYSFTIANSVFNEWGVNSSDNSVAAIHVSPNSITSFAILGNRFSGHSEFRGTSPLGIVIDPGTYEKYVVTGNIGESLLGAEGESTVVDSGNPSHGKSVHSNL